MANILSLNGLEFTDQGRTLSETREERSVEVQLANGKIKKYIMGVKRNWEIAWQWLPNDAAFTHDGLYGRDQLRGIAFAGNTFTMLLRNNYGQTDSYTVWVSEYNEQLIRRDDVNGQYFYNVTLSLREQ